MTEQAPAPIIVNTPNAVREAYLEELTGLRDPHIHLFVNDLSRKRMKIALKIDPGTVPVLLARFMHFSSRMAEAAGAFDQMLLLGAGLDTRPLWWAGLAGTRVRIIEVDLPYVVDSKRATLAASNIEYPANIRILGCDLAATDLLARLVAEGYDPTPAGCGLPGRGGFFLPPEITARLLDPKTLELARGSRILFDYRTNAALSVRNSREARLRSPVAFKCIPVP